MQDPTKIKEKKKSLPMKLACLCIFSPGMTLSSENSGKQLCSGLEEFFPRTSTHSLLTTCCPQNFLATRTVHEPRRGSPRPIACPEAQPVSCVMINPYLPRTHRLAERPRLRAGTPLAPSAEAHARFRPRPSPPPISPISSRLLTCNLEEGAKPKY